MWQYTGDIPDNAIGFVYKIIHLPTGKYYIGKKNLLMKRTLSPLKGFKRKRIVISESNWETYYSSNDWIQKKIKSGHHDEFERIILQFCFSKRELTYEEVRHQFINNVLKDPMSLNENILGKFF
jgi:hypothetical protein